VPVFIAATGVIILLLRLIFPERTGPASFRAAAEVLFMAVFSGFLGYLFWDVAMRRGNMTLVAALSYFTPVISTVVASLYLMRRLPGWQLWAGCALVTAGAVVSKLAIVEEPPAEPAS
jgi:drug/metabolite transporter (DMT)-like permease